MKFYVYRTTGFNERPASYEGLTKLTDDPESHDWIMEANSIDDAINLLMPDSPFEEFIVGRTTPEEPPYDVNWYIEIYD